MIYVCLELKEHIIVLYYRFATCNWVIVKLNGSLLKKKKKNSKKFLPMCLFDSNRAMRLMTYIE